MLEISNDLLRYRRGFLYPLGSESFFVDSVKIGWNPCLLTCSLSRLVIQDFVVQGVQGSEQDKLCAYMLTIRCRGREAQLICGSQKDLTEDDIKQLLAELLGELRVVYAGFNAFRQLYGKIPYADVQVLFRDYNVRLSRLRLLMRGDNNLNRLLHSSLAADYRSH